MRNLRGQISLVVLAIALGTAVLSAEVRTADSGLALDQTQATCTTTVSPDASIQAAIEAASAESVLCLEAGEWTEHVTIGKSLTLRGKGEELTVIKADEDELPVVRIDSSEEIDVVLAHLTVTGASRRLQVDGILLQGSAQATIRNSTIARNLLRGIRLEDSARAMIRRSTVSESGFSGTGIAGIGILLLDATRATIADSNISHHELGGILVDGFGEARINGNQISENRVGIPIGPGASALIRDNSIRGNPRVGISAVDTSEVSGRGNEMWDNGVDLLGSLPSALRQPLVPATEEEVVYPDERYPTLQHAVDALRPGGTLILRDGPQTAGVTLGKQLAIAAQEGTDVTLKAKNSASTALSLVRSAKLTITGLTVTRGAIGIILGADAQATIVESTVSKNRSAGLLIRGEAQATIRDSTIMENTTGIRMTFSAQASLVESIVSRNEIGRGIDLLDLAQVTIKGSRVSQNGTGLALANSSQATVNGSRISEIIRDNGVRLMGSAQATINDSTISNSVEDGIQLEDSSQLNLIGSTVADSDRDGIELMGSAQAAIRDNTISENRLDGIRLGNAVEATITGNEMLGNRHGVALFERPCSPSSAAEVFRGRVTGRQNSIPGPNESNGNEQGAVCPDELGFLMTEAGGDLDRRE